MMEYCTLVTLLLSSSTSSLVPCLRTSQQYVCRRTEECYSFIFPSLFSRGFEKWPSRHKPASVTSGLLLPHFTLVVDKTLFFFFSQQGVCLHWKWINQNLRHIWIVGIELATPDQPVTPHWWALVHIIECKKHCRFYRMNPFTSICCSKAHIYSLLATVCVTFWT